MKQIPGPLSGRSRAPMHGVYAFYRGQRIKIGTTEAMHSLRASQVHLVQPDPGSSFDPARDTARLLFRFPWPHEDGIEPGGYPNELYGRTLHKCPGRRQCRHHHGAHNLYYQRWANGVLVPVLACCTCSRLHHPRDLAGAQSLIAELRETAAGRDEAGDHEKGTLVHATADRIIAGYGTRLSQLGA